MNLFYKKYGTAGDPIFILHGIFGMLDNWHNIAKKLSEQFAVYTIDARNHGQSPHSDEMSYQLMAEDVIELANNLHIEKLILIGHSMGGKTAMWAAHQFPERIEKLVLVDIAPKAYKPGHDQYFKAFEEIPWSSLTNRKEIDEALMAYENNIGVRLFLAKNIERNEAGNFNVKSNIPALKKAYDEIGGELKFTNIYKGKTLFILGEKSNYLIEDDKPYILKYFPESTFVTVANAGHWVHADNSEGFVTELLNFLN